mmetsp:Transcript_78960/g.231783  ORF Transcript_78960/g.231783 Transcript_78960/m.231783 type:complete len:284 (-) Transcript_78960:911-1762(-)
MMRGRFRRVGVRLQDLHARPDVTSELSIDEEAAGRPVNVSLGRAPLDQAPRTTAVHHLPGGPHARLQPLDVHDDDAGQLQAGEVVHRVGIAGRHVAAAVLRHEAELPTREAAELVTDKDRVVVCILAIIGHFVRVEAETIVLPSIAMNADLIYEARSVLLQQVLVRMIGFVEHSKVHQHRMIASQAVFVAGTDARFLEDAFLRHGVVQHLHEVALCLNLEVATFLVIVFLPPIGAWLVERCDCVELDAPVLSGMLPNFSQVMGLRSEHVSPQVVGSGNTRCDV